MMMKRLFCMVILFFCIPAFASTLDEIVRLEALKAQNDRSINKSENIKNETAKRYITLSNNKRVDISEWQIVHFMSSDCSYCRQFNPILKKISDDTKIPVFVYSFDGKGDEYFPNVFMANKDVLNEFFAELPQATPTDFLINVNTLVTLPISQGNTGYQDFLHRLDEILIYADKHLGGLK